MKRHAVRLSMLALSCASSALGAQAVISPLINPLEQAVEQIGAWVVGLKSWLLTKEGNCESSEDFADAIEEYADANDLGLVWEED